MTSGRGGLIVVACSLGLTLGCNRTLQFDESSVDADASGMLADASSEARTDTAGEVATDTAVDAAAPDAACTDTLSCGWQLTECEPGDDDVCELHCAAGTTCPAGTCGTGCVAECQQAATCVIAGGDVTRVECKVDAHCTFTLGPGSNAACSAGSDCHIQCNGQCALNCQAGATCHLTCGSAPETEIKGTASCP